MSDNYKFFCHLDCEFYPCHQGLEEINCLFCFCPLYPLADCGGNFTINENGLKDCSNCLLPHKKENYDYIMQKLKEYYVKEKTNHNNCD